MPLTIRTFTGATVSLLNERDDKFVQRWCGDSIARSNSTLQTPELLRSTSCDSRADPISPQTPSYDPDAAQFPLGVVADRSANFQSLPAALCQGRHVAPYGAQPPALYERPVAPYERPVAPYAARPVASFQSRPPLFEGRPFTFDGPPTGVSGLSISPATSGSSSIPADRPAKRFPCRFRDIDGCRKSYTTSGHASRHAKSHTAKKGVHCTFPGCAKKFTRSDNTASPGLT